MQSLSKSNQNPLGIGKDKVITFDRARELTAREGRQRRQKNNKKGKGLFVFKKKSYDTERKAKRQPGLMKTRDTFGNGQKEKPV